MNGHVIVLLFFFAAYFTPTIVAVTAKNPQAFAIGVLNTLLGWTVIGWVVALVWAVVRPRDDLRRS